MTRTEESRYEGITKKKKYDVQTPNPTLNQAYRRRIVSRPLEARHSTFRGGISEPIHRWFRLTPSFGPQLVREVIEDFGVGENCTVLDPFAGAGTTLIECQLNRIRCYGFEIHPFLYWVTKTSLNRCIEERELQHDLKRLAKEFTKLNNVSPSNVDELSLEVPRIFNLYRWWRKDVLRDLLILKAAIKSIEASPDVTEFLRLALAGVLVPDLTNVTLGRLQLHFINRDRDNIHVWDTFEHHLATMISDVASNGHRSQEPACVFLQDATSVPSDMPVPAIDYVITSPPYPNRYSYVWNTRPHLFFFDFFRSARNASELDCKIIGGTWGTATSMLNKGIVLPEYDAVERYVVPVAELIRSEDNLMANYVVKYFNGLARQLVEMSALLSNGARIAYVVGCSRIKGVYVETDLMLAQIMENLPVQFSVDEIRRIRKRHSGKDLYESIAMPMRVANCLRVHQLVCADRAASNAYE